MLTLASHNLRNGIAFGEKRNKVLAMNNRVEESVAKATMTADSEL